MLDKILDNAVDFAHSNTQIILMLNKDESLTVMNIGDGIPEGMADTLFDTMVSVRKESENNDGLHLGLGLHIAKMIAEFHGLKIILQEQTQAAFSDEQTKCVTVSLNKSANWYNTNSDALIQLIAIQLLLN